MFFFKVWSEACGKELQLRLILDFIFISLLKIWEENNRTLV